MKKIKTYEDFISEEINLKKGLIGTAIAISSLGGMTSCEKEKIEPTEIVSQTSYVNKVIIKKVVAYPTSEEIIVIQNISKDDIDLNGWFITDSYGNKCRLYGKISSFQKKSYNHNQLGFYINDNGDHLSIISDNGQIVTSYSGSNSPASHGVIDDRVNLSYNIQVNGQFNRSVQNSSISCDGLKFFITSNTSFVYNNVPIIQLSLSVDCVPGTYNLQNQTPISDHYFGHGSFLHLETSSAFGNPAPQADLISGNIIVEKLNTISVIFDASGKYYIVEESNKEHTLYPYRIKFKDVNYKIRNNWVYYNNNYIQPVPNQDVVRVSDFSVDFINYKESGFPEIGY